MTLELFPGSVPNLSTLMALVGEKYPDAMTGIVIVYDKDGNLHTHWHCNKQEMSMAAVRLTVLAGSDQ